MGDAFLEPSEKLLKEGVSFITFLFPGATDPFTGRSSEGVYDKRGINCINALYDVLRYAHGEIPDTSGFYITEISSFPIDTTVIGLVGKSNGGNLCVVTLDVWGIHLIL